MTVENIVENIRSGKEGRKSALKSLYNDQKLKKGIGRVVKNILGSHNYLDDIFNLSLVQFFKNVIRNPDFELDSNLNNHLFNIARFLCLAKQREQNKTFSTVHEEFEMIKENMVIDLQIINTERRIAFLRIIKKMDAKCQKILSHWSSGMGLNESTRLLGYASENVTSKKKNACLKALAIFLNENPDIKNELS